MGVVPEVKRVPPQSLYRYSATLPPRLVAVTRRPYYTPGQEPREMTAWMRRRRARELGGYSTGEAVGHPGGSGHFYAATLDLPVNSYVHRAYALAIFLLL